MSWKDNLLAIILIVLAAWAFKPEDKPCGGVPRSLVGSDAECAACGKEQTVADTNGYGGPCKVCGEPVR